MKDIFKGSKKYFQVVFAIILVSLAYYFVVYFTGVFPNKVVIKEPSILPPSEEMVVEEQYVDFSKFGVVHIKVESPSYAKSNFDVNPGTSIEVYFNEEISLDTIFAKFKLFDEDTGTVIPVETTTLANRSPENSGDSAWKWQRVWKHKIVFTPMEELNPITRYSAKVAAGYSDISGNKIAEDNFRFDFMTADTPGVLSSNLDKASVLRSNDSIKIFFRSPMDTAEIDEKMAVKPYLDSLIFTNNDKVLVINNTFEKGETYNLVLPSSTKDIYGRNLGESIDYTFTVQ